MKYEAVTELDELISAEEKRLVKAVYFWFIAFFVVLAKIFFPNRVIDLKICLCVALFAIVMRTIQYYQVVPGGRIINNTAIEVIIEDDRIIFKTSPFKVLFWINEPSKEFVIFMDELKMRKIPYMVKPVYNLDNRVWKLSDDNNFVYVITDYFDKELEGMLVEILYKI